MTLRTRARGVRRQTRIPVVCRDTGLIVRLPYALDNRDWLRNDRRANPEWVRRQGVWRIPKAWFDDTIKRCIARYGAAWVIQPTRTTEKCAPACWFAEGETCECSCWGARHGTGRPEGRWYTVSNTFAVSYGPRQRAYRLLVQRSV